MLARRAGVIGSNPGLAILSENALQSALTRIRPALHRRDRRQSAVAAIDPSLLRQEQAKMATRQARLDAFPSDAERPEGQAFEILCEDHVGTYALPFFCLWRDDDWWSAESGERIDAKVVGWRRPPGS